MQQTPVIAPNLVLTPSALSLAWGELLRHESSTAEELADFCLACGHDPRIAEARQAFIKEHLLGDLSLAAATHPQIGNLKIAIDPESGNLILGVEADGTCNLRYFSETLHGVSRHLMAISSANSEYPSGDPNPNWANPWELGLADHDDHTDYMGTYLVPLAQLLSLKASFDAQR